MTAAQPPARRSRRAVLVAAAVTAAGLALLAWQVHDVGLDRIAAGFSAVGAGFLLVLLLSLVRFLLRAVAWRALLAGDVTLTSALGAAMAGDAIGNLTPFSVLVGEPAKALYISRSVGASRAFAALAAENYFYSVSVALYVIFGTAAMFVAFPVADAVRDAGVVALLMMAVVLSGAAWMAWQRPTLASTVLARLPGARFGSLADRVRAFERQTYGSARAGRGPLVLVLLSEAGFHILSFLEVWFVLWLLAGESLPLQAFVLDTFSRIVNVVFKVVPLRLGVDESVSKVVAEAIALTAATGLTLALVRKGRMLVWSAVGIALVARRGLTSRADPRSPSTS